MGGKSYIPYQSACCNDRHGDEWLSSYWHDPAFLYSPTATQHAAIVNLRDRDGMGMGMETGMEMGMGMMTIRSSTITKPSGIQVFY